MARRRAVFFDMDDTIFDHTGTSRAALRQLSAEVPALTARPFDQVARRYAELLDEIYPSVMAGRATHEEARDERFLRLLEFCGETVSRAEAHAYSAEYRRRYQELRTVVPGADALLDAIRAEARVGIVTNNHTAEQQDKLSFLGIDRKIDFLLTSEEARSEKPNPEIFRQALDRVGCRPEEAVMVGDSWVLDVRGAISAGIPAIWFNRFSADRPEPVVVPELRAWTPVAQVAASILGPSAGIS